MNEDFAGVVRAPTGERSRGLIAAVADGVSGAGFGLEAAQTTVMGLTEDFYAAPATWESTVVLDRLIGAQNAWLADHNRRRSGTGAALTTLTALVLQGQTWTLAHVGDTRAWLLRQSGDGLELTQLSQDHAWDDLDLSSRLTRAVGMDESVRVDYSQGDVRVGDVFVLTSDGVHRALKDKRIAELAARGSAPQACEALVQAALSSGGRDNATAVVIRINGLSERELDDELGDFRRLPAPAPLKVGQALDGHVITARVADNGVHILYQARGSDGRSLVAIKTLHPSRASDAEERAMLAHEAWLGGRVGGRGFVRVHPRPANATALYVVFDWHPGHTLEHRMAGAQRGAVPEVVKACIEWLQALGRLHRQGVIHRDIKPANLHLGDDGQWRILDLGAAVSGRESSVQRALRAGTPSYMNPEQWDDDGRADQGSDLYAVGATMYQWLAGRLPFGDLDPWQIHRQRQAATPISRLRPDVPIWLDHVLCKALARHRAERFETAEEFLLAMQRGAARPLGAPKATPLLSRDPADLWRVALLVSLLFNALLVLWLLFLPR